MTPDELLSILSRAARLKTTYRHCDTAPDRKESVADHSWRISLMAMLLSGEERDAADTARFEERWGKDVYDPCYSRRFGRKKANYHYQFRIMNTEFRII